MATRLTELPALEPDPLTPDAVDVERYVEALQGLSKANADFARRAAWNQIRLAGVRAKSRPAEAHDSLNRMFRLGVPPSAPLDGPMHGILVTPTIPRPADAAIRGLASLWMPWTGKRFDSAAETGDNVLIAGARPIARVLFPSYRLEPLDDGNYSAFRFRTYVSPGKVDPDRQTLKIDYDSDENPRLLIRDILDELVQVVPGAYLGKVLLRRKGAWQLIGYFALEPAAGARTEEPVVAAPGEPVPEPASAG
jgi:hypothetical protein